MLWIRAWKFSTRVNFLSLTYRPTDFWFVEFHDTFIKTPYGMFAILSCHAMPTLLTQNQFEEQMLIAMHVNRYGRVSVCTDHHHFLFSNAFCQFVTQHSTRSHRSHTTRVLRAHWIRNYSIVRYRDCNKMQFECFARNNMMIMIWNSSEIWMVKIGLDRTTKTDTSRLQRSSEHI